MQSCSGVVMRGEGRGRKLGFPTANIALPEGICGGVYAGSVRTESDAYPAAIFADEARGLLESHLIGFVGDLYGQTVSVAIGRKLRDSVHVLDDEALKVVIARDVEEVMRVLE